MWGEYVTYSMFMFQLSVHISQYYEAYNRLKNVDTMLSTEFNCIANIHLFKALVLFEWHFPN